MSEVVGGANKTLAQVAFEAYVKHQDGKAYNDTIIPPWHRLPDDIKEAWIAAVMAVLDVSGVG